MVFTLQETQGSQAAFFKLRIECFAKNENVTFLSTLHVCVCAEYVGARSTYQIPNLMPVRSTKKCMEGVCFVLFALGDRNIVLSADIVSLTF